MPSKRGNIVLKTIMIIVLGYSDFTRMKNKNCGPDVYTNKAGSLDCDGWRGITESECIQKCRANEVPVGCTKVLPNTQCKYAQFDRTHGWCHLGNDESCTITKDTDWTLFQKISRGDFL